MRFKVTATKDGDRVKFIVGDADEPEDLKDALPIARDEAKRIFGYEEGKGMTTPKVSIEPILEKETWEEPEE